MNQLQFSVEIHATKKKVWATMWNDKTFRQWAGLIDPGTYMVGELVEGGEVQFISEENGYGVISKVEKLIVNEHLLFRHSADTQDSGAKERDKEWTGGEESYSLVEKGGITTLTAAFDVPLKMEEFFTESYPKALNQIKIMAEQELA